MPEESAGDDQSADGSKRPGRRRAAAVGATVAVLATWVVVAVFVAPGGSKTNSLAQISGAPTAGNTGYGYGFGGGNGGAPGGFSRRGTSGVIQAVAGPTITLLDRSGASVTVQTTTQTAYTKTVNVGVHQMRAGDTIVASGLYSAANATLTAGRVTILGTSGTIPGGGRAFSATQGNTAVGTVTSIAGDQLTVDLSDGSLLTVIMSPSVTVSAPMAGSLRDLVQGESITVRGPSDANGDVEASQIQEGTNAGFFGPGFGRSPINSGGSFHLTPAGVMQS